MKSGQAIAFLGQQYGNANRLEGLPSREAESTGGRPANLYRTVDIERVKALMAEARLPLSAAVRVRVAELAGKL